MSDETTAQNTHEGLNPAPAAAPAESMPAAGEHSAAASQTNDSEQTERSEQSRALEELLSHTADEPVSAQVAAVYMPPLAPAPAHEEHDGQPEDMPAPPADPAVTYRTALSNGGQQNVGGIEILIQMAEKGEIDPKNIDIIDVTDRFLKAISAVPKENLRQSGKIIFQASVLLRMKAEALLAAKVEDEMGFGDDYVDFDIDGSPIIYDSNHQPIARQITLADLERALVRQTKVRQMRHRRVTLEQLIEALREAERLESSRGERKIKPRIAIDGYNEMRDMDDILELAHDEDIEDVIARIERLLADMLAADDLLPLLHIVEVLGGKGDWVDAFLAVLFLSNAGKITLQQERFYGPLFVQRPEPLGTGLPIVIPPAVPDSGPPLTH